MKYVIIGDLHGKVEIARHFLGSSEYEGAHKVFVGDYLDSFDRPVTDHIELVNLLLDACETRDDVTCLLGNHELSYIREGATCSGYNPATAIHIVHLKERMLLNFKKFKWVDNNILITHAGANGKVFPNQIYLNHMLHTDDDMLYNIGRCRGGLQEYGGIFWCDFWGEYTPIENLIQISGHTAYRPNASEGVLGIVEMDSMFNVDCLDKVNEFLEVNTNLNGADRFKIKSFDIS